MPGEGRGAVALDQRIDYRRELHAGCALRKARPMPPDVRERALLMARDDFNLDTAIGDTRGGPRQPLLVSD